MNNDDQSAFNFNNSLINYHYGEILDLIGGKISSKKKIKANKEKIIKYLSETFIGITEEKLTNLFETYLKLMPGCDLKRGNLNEIKDSLNKFSLFILETGSEYKDHGYSLILSCYFWLTDKY